MPKKNVLGPVKIQRPVVWVTGASMGIGKEIAKQFASIGCIVALSARSRKRLAAVEKEIVTLGGIAYSYTCDVANRRSVFNAFRRIKDRCGPIDILVNNAGKTVFKSFQQTSLQDFENVFAVNLRGAIHTIKAVLPQMRKRKRGWIVNVLSTAALKTFTDSSAYSITKAGLRTLGNVLREEVRRSNVRVTNVYPGSTNTEMWSNPDRRKYHKRMMSPRSVAEVVLGIYQMPPDVVVEDIVIRPIHGDLD